MVLGGNGTSTSAIAFGGNDNPPTEALTEQWNGTSWTEVSDLSTARDGGASGTSPSASGFFAGGRSTPGAGTITGVTEQWAADMAQGAWSSGGDLNTARAYLGATKTGSQTASLVFGGTPPTNGRTENESYNGTSWTELADLNTGRYSPGGAGSTTAALAFGGETAPGKKDETETWNGSSWTEVGDLNTAKPYLGSAGTNTAALAFGGEKAPPSPTVLNETESWNGSAWTETANLNTARYALAGVGTTNTEALAFGGHPNRLVVTESWNGSAWTEVNDLNTARGYFLSGAGTYTAALAFGGNTPAPAVSGATETWNGSVWYETTDLSTARMTLAGAGTSTAALAVGGQTPSVVAATEEWSGTSNTTKTISTD